ncbi:MAG TPA: FlgD immunoglobulin-like domain containing protein [Candidatus Saccharimonadales bacterium]|nr:FlgD immunoglobulin-like domain containing protein [Candidatus Saccharimonadales bacterium]
MNKLALALISLLALASFVGVAWADGGLVPQDHALMSGWLNGHSSRLAPTQYRPAALQDTVWYGFVPGGTPVTTDYYYPPAGKTVPALWDFDRAPDGSHPVAGSLASWQGWTGHHNPYLSGLTRAPATAPEVWLNYGNHPYTTANYSYAAPYWHQQDMTAVPQPPGFGANMNIEGTGALWCGMLPAVAIDVLHDYRTTPYCAIDFPGYGDLWDQYVVKDISIGTGGTTLTFKYATDMDVRMDAGGSATPMQNGSLFDALSVWVGTPTVALPLGAAIPTNSDIDDLLLNDASRNNLSPSITLSPGITSCPALDCNGFGGKSDSSGTSFTTVLFGQGLLNVGPNARVLFRVRTNRTNSDQWLGQVSYDGIAAHVQPGGSNIGAAEVDEVYFSNANGYNESPKGFGLTNAYKFNTAGDLEGWSPCGKVLPIYSQIIDVGNNDPNVGGLGYDTGSPEIKYADPCGVPGAGSSFCNLKNNVLAQFDMNGTSPGTNPRDKYSQNWPIVNGDMQQSAYSPPVHILGTPGFGRAGCDVEWDTYLYLPADDAVFFWIWVRYKPGLSYDLVTTCPGWSAWQRDPVIYYQPQPTCGVNEDEQSQLMPTTTITDMELLVGTPTFCWSYGPGGPGTCHANFSPLWDNLRIGMWNAPDAPAIILFDWQYWQDAYPVDVAIPYAHYLSMQKRSDTPGSNRQNNPLSSPDFYVKNIPANNTAIDSKTALITACVTNNTRPYTRSDGGVNQSDSVAVQSSFDPGRPSRMDCVFRVLPGPLTNATGPWFQAYINNIGQYGTTGVAGQTTHPGGVWRWWVWNSVQLDTSEYDSWDSTANNRVQGPGATPQYYATTIHEDDPHYAGLGMNHCLPLVDPTPGTLTGQWLAECSGVYSQEHTNIFPNYVFTPGTVITYFYRSAYLDNLNGPGLLPDTTQLYSLGSHYFIWRVLPDAWKDPTYGLPPWHGKGWLGGDGTGQLVDDANPGLGYLAKNEITHNVGRPCVLFVDHSFGLSQCYFQYHGAFDTVGISPFVDDYTSQAPSSGETGIGNYVCPLAGPGYTFAGSSGPSITQLSGYGEIYYNGGTLDSPSLSDGQNDGDANADVQLLDAWLKLSGGKRGLWLNGTSMALNLSVLRPIGSPSRTFSSGTLGVLDGGVDGGSSADNYRTLSGNSIDCPEIIGATSPWLATTKMGVVGNLCAFNYDVIPPRTDILGPNSSQLYSVGNMSAGVINSVAATGGGTSKTLIDALDFRRLRNELCFSSYGRILQMKTVYNGWFKDGSGNRFCPDPVSPVAVGEPQSGVVNALFQNTPNPFRPTRATTIRYSVARTSPVTLKIMDVAGRVVRTLVDGSKLAGVYTATFDGRDTRGMALASGVYFYRLKIGDFESNKKMLMLK